MPTLQLLHCTWRCKMPSMRQSCPAKRGETSFLHAAAIDVESADHCLVNYRRRPRDERVHYAVQPVRRRRLGVTRSIMDDPETVDPCTFALAATKIISK